MQVFIITGTHKTGKSETLLQVIENLKTSSNQIHGFVQPCFFKENEHYGYDIHLYTDTNTPLVLPLARRNPMFWDILDAEQQSFLPRIPRWKFDNNAFETVQQEMRKLLNKHFDDEKTHVFVVDELGWLESTGKGHMEIVREMLAGCKKIKKCFWVASVRDGFTDHFANEFNKIIKIREDILDLNKCKEEDKSKFIEKIKNFK